MRLVHSRKHLWLGLAAAMLALLAALSYHEGWWGKRYRVAVGMNLQECLDATCRTIDAQQPLSVTIGAEYLNHDARRLLDQAACSIHYTGVEKGLLLVVERNLTEGRETEPNHVDTSDPAWRVVRIYTCPHWREEDARTSDIQQKMREAEEMKALTRRELNSFGPLQEAGVVRQQQDGN